MTSLLRDRRHDAGVSNTELFFDLVYVLAVTELSQFLRDQHSWTGILQATVLLGMTWNAWVYTTWVTNWLTPDRRPTRLMLLIVMAASLVFSAGFTRAADDRGLWIGCGYAFMQVGRSAYAAWAMRGDRLQRNYLRILAWCVAGGSLAVAGGFATGTARWALFAAAVGVDVFGGVVQFWTPGLGRTPTSEWTVDGGHFAERCQAFVLIALGESVVGIGAPLISAESVDGRAVAGILGAFVGVVALFWLYFDRWAHRGVRAIESSDDPGRMARAFHMVHPVLIAGIILIAAGEEEILHPLLTHGEHTAAPHAYTAWLCAGGAALFAVGHGAYVWLLSSRVPRLHLIAAVLFVLVGALSGHPDPLTVGYLTGGLLVLLVLADSVTDAR